MDGHMDMVDIYGMGDMEWMDWFMDGNTAKKVE